MNRDSSPHRIANLLAQGMSSELHWFAEDVPVARLAAVLVGMANTLGGNILIGATPRSGHIQGVSDPGAVLDRVFQAALMAEPVLVLPLPRVEPVSGLKVIVIHVPVGLPNVYSLEGRYLWRDGAQTEPLSARRLRQLLMERGTIQFESQLPPGASLADLDWEKVHTYADTLRKAAVVNGDSDEELLVRRGCLKRAGSSLRPTYAALLLFGLQPQQWLPNATILAARFSGAVLSDRYIKHEISGTLPDQLRQAEIFVRDHMRSIVRLVGLTHQETSEYPFEAVRELMVNAVAHRDYNVQGDDIHLYLFADRIEVHSPGKLPGPVTLENLLQARFSRNAIIVQVLADMGFVERLGYGLDRVVTVMRQAGMRPPQFEEVAGSFRVTLFGEEEEEQAEPAPEMEAFRDLVVNPRQEAALAYLCRYRRITNRDYQDICPDVHPETLRRDLADLVGRGVIVKVGDKRATYYILK